MPLLTVIGRGHSGTRLIAHTLKQSGVDMGARLNPSGSGDLVPAEAMYEACRILGRHVVYRGWLQWDFSWLQERPVDAAFRRLVESYLASVLGSSAEYRGWKLPETTLALPWIVRLFPEARYVFWVRDPRDVILYPHFSDDLSKLGVPCERFADPLYARAVSWKYQWDIVRATPKPAHWLPVRFEDFIGDQPAALRRLEAFLGLPLPCLPVRTDPIGRWRRQPRQLDFPFLEEPLRQLGYR